MNLNLNLQWRRRLGWALGTSVVCSLWGGGNVQSEEFLTLPPSAIKFASSLPRLAQAEPNQPSRTEAGSSPVMSPESEAGLEAAQKKSSGRWSVAFGVGVISDNTLADYLEPSFDKLHGPGGGLTYNFTVTRRLHEFDWGIGRIHLHPTLEMPMMLTLVDENTGRVIPDLNIGVTLRWRDFPWNRWVRTTLSAGPGLSYSFQVWTADWQRHEDDDDRSRLKFWLPIEFTLALPKVPQHQLILFIDHQSGGTLFDFGGVDAWGLGYRFDF